MVIFRVSRFFLSTLEFKKGTMFFMQRSQATFTMQHTVAEQLKENELNIPTISILEIVQQQLSRIS